MHRHKHAVAHPPRQAPWPCEGGIQDLRPVGCRQQQDAGAALEAVELRQQLVQGLVALLVQAQPPLAACAGTTLVWSTLRNGWADPAFRVAFISWRKAQQSTEITQPYVQKPLL